MIHARNLRAFVPRISRRSVTIWPQWPYDTSAKNAKPVGDPTFRWPPGRRAPPARAEPAKALEHPKLVDAERLKLHRRIWRAMAHCDWGEWERTIWEMRDRSIPFDETTYIFLIHGYLLSHRHSGENACMALEEMRAAEVHPALFRLQERMLSAAFELQELDCRPEGRLWQHVARLSWHCTLRFHKKRRDRLKTELNALEPDEALSLQPPDIQRWLRRHDRKELPPPDTGVARFLPQQSTAMALPSSTESAEIRRRRRMLRMPSLAPPVPPLALPSPASEPPSPSTSALRQAFAASATRDVPEREVTAEPRRGRRRR